MILARTEEALRRYDAARDMYLTADHLDPEETRMLDEVLASAAQDVREAFADDTAHCNLREVALMVDPDSQWLRDMVANAKKSS